MDASVSWTVPGLVASRAVTYYQDYDDVLGHLVKESTPRNVQVFNIPDQVGFSERATWLDAKYFEFLAEMFGPSQHPIQDGFHDAGDSNPFFYQESPRAKRDVKVIITGTLPRSAEYRLSSNLEVIFSDFIYKQTPKKKKDVRITINKAK